MKNVSAKWLRIALGQAAGRRALSVRELADLLGMGPNGNVNIRRWEDGTLTPGGPARTALSYLAQAAAGEDIASIIPVYLVCDAMAPERPELSQFTYVLRTRYPRFLGMVGPAGAAEAVPEFSSAVDSAPLDDLERLYVLYWIDPPGAADSQAILEEAAKITRLELLEEKVSQG